MRGAQEAAVYKEKILVVDYDVPLSLILATKLNILGYKVLLASNGKDALNTFNREQPNLVILDILLPKLDGYEVCRKIRENSQVPIIILTALGGISHKVTGLNLGADDYIIKPFSLKELEARIYSVLRRAGLSTRKFKKGFLNIFYVANLIINIEKRQVLKNGTRIKLTEIEFTLLELLIKNAGKKLSRTTILDNIWGYTPERDVDTRVVDVHISRLRSKLEEDPSKPILILTARGAGYIFQNLLK